MRIFKTINDKVLNSKIAEYTNSQNSISSVDLKSLRPEQIQLEQYLSENEIAYSRKAGDIGLTNDTTFKYQISMERFGQILYSLKGSPHKASSRKKQIFDKYYDETFGEGVLEVEKSPEQIKKYFEIKAIYESKARAQGYDFSDQKAFYILYLQHRIDDDKEIIIDKFEETLNAYSPKGKKPMTHPRKLLLVDFKKFVDKRFLE